MAIRRARARVSRIGTVFDETVITVKGVVTDWIVKNSASLEETKTKKKKKKKKKKKTIL